jgi:hypothetical protein
MAQTFSLANSLGAGRQLKSNLESAVQNREFNSLRASGERQRQDIQQRTFEADQQTANTKKMLFGIDLLDKDLGLAPRVLDEFARSGLINEQVIPAMLAEAQNSPDTFRQKMSDFRSQLLFALGEAPAQPKFGRAQPATRDGKNVLIQTSPSGVTQEVEDFGPPPVGAGGGVTGSLQELQAINVDRQAAGEAPLSTEQFLTTRRQTSVNQQAFNRLKSENPNDPTTFEQFTARFAGNVAEAKTLGSGQAKRQLDLPQARSRMAATDAKMDRLATAAQSILDDDGLWQAVGLGRGLSVIPSGAGARVRAKIENIQSQAGLAVLQDMRDNSKTGGAVGQVSNFEQQLFQNNLAPLGNLNVSPEDYRRAVQALLDYAVSTKGRFRDAFLFTYPELREGRQPRDDAQEVARFVFDPATGQLVPK